MQPEQSTVHTTDESSIIDLVVVTIEGEPFISAKDEVARGAKKTSALAVDNEVRARRNRATVRDSFALWIVAMNAVSGEGLQPTDRGDQTGRR